MRKSLFPTGLDNPDPGGARPKGELRAGPTSRKGQVKKDKRCAWTKSAAEVELRLCLRAIVVRGPISLGGLVLKITLNAERLRNVEPATLRVFCFDATSGEWQLVPRSGARAEAGYAWAHLQRPGLYITIGLPAGANALVTVLTFRALMPKLRAAADEAARRRVLELIGVLLSPGRAVRH